MKILKKILGFLYDCVEKYIPMVAFSVLFLVFCFQVFMRYVVRNPQAWTTEVEQACFLWLVLLGACYAQRLKAHVTFTLVYDNLGVKGKALTAFLGNLLITFTCLITTVPSCKYIIGLLSKNSVTTILKIEKAFIFAPYVIFLVFIMVYAAIELWTELMALFGNQKYIDLMLNSSKSEAEIAIEESLAQEQLDLNNISYE